MRAPVTNDPTETIARGMAKRRAVREMSMRCPFLDEPFRRPAAGRAPPLRPPIQAQSRRATSELSLLGHTLNLDGADEVDDYCSSASPNSAAIGVNVANRPLTSPSGP